MTNKYENNNETIPTLKSKKLTDKELIHVAGGIKGTPGGNDPKGVASGPKK
ncbi:MAG: hypothetical protein J5959_08775 [Butyrivibrio sp.]|nr:hypothetical protein [Butyrivibrio sp.]